MFGSTIREKCSCGATFSASGMSAGLGAASWRVDHPCPNRRPRLAWGWGGRPPATPISCSRCLRPAARGEAVCAEHRRERGKVTGA